MPLRIIRFVAALVVAWCVMTWTHEVGHILGGWSCGGKLSDFDLLPWHLPYSTFDPDPWPLVTLWGGPLFGVIFPLCLAWGIRQEWMWFIANFCMLANGTYLAAAWYAGDRYLDTPRLLASGADPATIALYCLLTIGFGYTGFRKSCQQLLSRNIAGPKEIA